MWLRRLGTCNNNKAAVGDSQHVELLTRVSWLSLRQIVASMGPGTYGTKLILSVVRYVLRKGYKVQTVITMLHSYIRTRAQTTGRSRTHAHTRATLVLAAGVR